MNGGYNGRAHVQEALVAAGGFFLWKVCREALPVCVAATGTNAALSFVVSLTLRGCYWKQAVHEKTEA